MRVSIVTPSWNYGRFMRDCVESVMKQGYDDFEHLIFDAGSTDETLLLLQEYPHVRLVVEPDKGMSDAINKGFNIATGDLVMWLNADDRLKPGALRAVVAFAQAHPDADVIYGCWDFIDESGERIRTMTLFPFNHNMLLYLGCYIGSTATFLRRATVLNSGERLNIRFNYVMDGEFYARLAYKGFKFKYMPSVIADFRVHGGNLSLANYGKTSIDDNLRLQYQYSETRAYRRTYSKQVFKDENLNQVMDGVLFYFYRGWKFLLKKLYQSKLRRLEDFI